MVGQGAGAGQVGCAGNHGLGAHAAELTWRNCAGSKLVCEAACVVVESKSEG